MITPAIFHGGYVLSKATEHIRTKDKVYTFHGVFIFNSPGASKVSMPIFYTANCTSNFTDHYNNVLEISDL